MKALKNKFIRTVDGEIVLIVKLTSKSNNDRSHVPTAQKPTDDVTQSIVMYSAGLLALLITFAFNQMQTKYLLVETEDNSEADPMPKEEVKAVLAALKFPEGIYNSLSKSSQQKIQKKLLKLYGTDQEEVRYINIYVLEV